MGGKGNKKSKSGGSKTKSMILNTKNVETQTKVNIKIPPTIALLYDALVELDNSSGNTFQSITNYIESKYLIDYRILVPNLKKIMKQEIAVENIFQVGRKFVLLNQKEKPAKKQKVPKKNKVGHNRNGNGMGVDRAEDNDTDDDLFEEPHGDK